MQEELQQKLNTFSLSTFQERVYLCASLVPAGKVTTYKDIAVELGVPKAARAVGNALNKNPLAPLVPCHRVVHSNGNVDGFANGTKAKIALLAKEGVLVVGEKVADFANVRFMFK